jgi:hypothetical protein
MVGKCLPVFGISGDLILPALYHHLANENIQWHGSNFLRRALNQSIFRASCLPQPSAQSIGQISTFVTRIRFWLMWRWNRAQDRPCFAQNRLRSQSMVIFKFPGEASLLQLFYTGRDATHAWREYRFRTVN